MKYFDGICRKCGEHMPIAAMDEEDADLLVTEICACERIRERERLLSKLSVPKTRETEKKEEV